MISRRGFVVGAGVVAGTLLSACHAVRAFASAGSSIEILLDEPLGTISPNVYGHFAENLGGVIYDGVWVGEDSKVANIGGVRKALVDEMRKIKPAVIRYPGGCFADSYDWRDGVGPPAARPRRTNFWADNEAAAAPAGQKYDSNRFGTTEFVHFCKLVGSEPYLAANVRSLPGDVFDRWVEYCNSPAGSTTLADARSAAGSAQPFDVRFWAVGNEAWGCGGTFTPQEYAEEFCRYVASVPDYGVDLRFIASGPDKDDWKWTRGFFEEVALRGKGELGAIYGFALHDYTWNLSRGRTRDWVKGKGDALSFEPVDWYELLQVGSGMEPLIEGHWKVMQETDPGHVVKLVVDEWGSWYRPGSEATPGDLFEQTPTLRDAAFSAMTLDIFNRHPDKVAMANCAQLINCLNSLYLGHEDRFCVTPVGHVFAMYAPHQGGRAVRAVFSVPPIAYDRDGKPASFWGLNGSASLRDKTLTLTVVNPHVSDPRETAIAVRGATVVSGVVTTLSDVDIHAHNSFDRPNAIVPKHDDLKTSGGNAIVTFPPASVTSVTLTLA